MVLGYVLVILFVLSLVCAAISGNMEAVSAAALSGASEAVTLLLGIGGTLCLWSGVMELMRRSGIAERLSRCLRPLLRLLFPRAGRDQETLAALAANFSANLLGLGNAATPPGLTAARRMARGSNGCADDELCRLVVLNSCSVQLLPTTAAALRAANGASKPLDILAAVWVASALSVLAGLLAAQLFSRMGRNR